METIRHYRIVRELGAGGMGLVYLAEDSRLKRKVALKVLPQTLVNNAVARERLFREAESAAALDHANVATIYEVGEENGVAFIAMQYVDGETLHDRLARGPMPVGEAVDIAIAIGEAVAEAHRLSIVHRDLKANNVMLTPRGQVKVLDFGLAKTFGDGLADQDDETRREITKTGEIVGTLAYMSPEQLRGERLDARADIFSFGIVAYEMLAHERPFDGKTTADTISRILMSDPAPLDHRVPALPAELASIVMTCLKKQPEERFGRMQDIVEALIRVRASMSDRQKTARPAKRKTPARRRQRSIDSIAVLPFENAGADEYLSDGLTDLTTMQLSRIPRMRVMARSTVYAFKGRIADARQIGEELNVRAVLTGRVRTTPDSVVIGVELIDTGDGALIWAEQFERPMSDLSRVQSEIASAIVERCRPQRSASDRRRELRHHSTSEEAYRLYLQGRFWWAKRPQEGYMRALDYFQQAIDRDPLYALAYSGLADSLAILGSWESGVMRPTDVMPRAKAAAQRALELDDQLADAYASLAYVQLHFDWDWTAARSAFARAVELNPNCANAQHWSSHFFAAAADFPHSYTMSCNTMEVDPLDLVCNVHMAWHRWMAREPEAGLEACRRIQQIDARSMWIPFFEGLLLGLEDRWDEAVARLRAARDIAPSITFALSGLAYALGRSGDHKGVHELIGQLRSMSADRYVPAYDLAVAHIGAGEIDAAFDALGKAVEERSSWVVYLDVEPRLDLLRSDARFAALRQRIGLPVA